MVTGDLRGKVALITGGSSGIGKATVEAFARNGAMVAIADIQQERGDELVSSLERQGGKALYIQTDVSDQASVEDMVNQTLDRFGRLDYAFNNAGIEGDMAPTAEVDADNVEKVIDINVKGVMYCMRYEIPAMLQNDGGAIVNTASVAGMVGFPQLAPYVASKHAVIGLTRTAALEYSQENVRVNAVAPGVIQTPMVERSFSDQELQGLVEQKPIGRLGDPEEIANAVLFLCSESASFVTGHILVVDGGFTAG